MEYPLNDLLQGRVVDNFYMLANDAHHSVDWATACHYSGVSFEDFEVTRSLSARFAERIAFAEKYVDQKINGALTRMALGSATEKPSVAAAKTIMASRIQDDPMEKEKAKMEQQKRRRVAQRMSKVDEDDFSEVVEALDDL